MRRSAELFQRLHKKQVQVSTITAQELKSKIDNKENFYLIDVREPSEYEIVKIPTAHLIPKQGFIDGSVLASLPQR
jgi:adenylyltransferase/sulfurtransferase